MSELSPVSGGLPAVAAPYNDSSRARNSSGMMTTILLLLIVGAASLLIAEQILTGWLALGERANIPRSNLNPIELMVAAGAILWGLVALRTGIGFLRHERVPSMQAYFDGRSSRMAPGVLLTTVLLGVIGFIALILAEQIWTGWLALGARVNIPRSNLNGPEISTILIALLWGVVTLRTVYGMIARDRRTWAWAQWVILLTAVIGLSLLMNGIFDIHTIIPRDGTLVDNLPGTQEMTAPGLIIFLSCVAVYRFISIGVDTTATETIRNRLAKSPGAGGIIGFIALFVLFALASDLFLEQRSVAGMLANNITRGVVAVGVTLLMISGEFDLSVGSTFGAGALVFLLMLTEGLPMSTLLAVPLIIIGLAVLSSGYSRGRRSTSLAGAGMVLLAFIVPIVSGVFGWNAPVVTSVIPAMLIALAFAALLGLVNGVILIRTGIPSFIVTLGTLLAYRAILLVVVADGRILRYADYRLPPPNITISRVVMIAFLLAVAGLIAYMGYRLIPASLASLRSRRANYANDPSDFRDLHLILDGVRAVVTLIGVVGGVGLMLLAASNQVTALATSSTFDVSFFDLMNGKFDFVDRDVNLRSGVIWWLLLVVVFQFILTQTRYGNHVFAVGGNPGAARAQGIDVDRVKVTNFIICAMLACFAGIITVSRVLNVDPLNGEGLELEVIAASVIGGALLSGGYGSFIGAFLGVLIFGMLQTGLVLVGVDNNAFSGFIGVIIIIAVIINTAVRRARK